jgi:hypothetical protein
MNPLFCLQCQGKPPVGESKFCSAECRAAFAKGMAEAIACHLCDAQIDGITAATAAGWTDIGPDPEGTSWNYLGLCPECRATEEVEERATVDERAAS